MTDTDVLDELLVSLRKALPKELRRYTYKSDLGLCIHHPLVVEIMAHPSYAHLIAKRFEMKKAHIDECLATHNYSSYVFTHERPYRVEAFQDIFYDLRKTPPEFWGLLSHVWTDSENIYQHLDTWMAVWDESIPDRHYVMTEEERAILADLPATIEVWRGVKYDSAVEGMSWTIDRDKAIWFANRWIRKDDTPKLVTATVEKDDVLAYFDGRGESEIVAQPHNVTIKDISVVRRKT